MKNVVMMVTIAKRNKSEELLDCFNKNQVAMTLGRYGQGTVNDELMDYLGIEDKEKCVMFSTMLNEKAKRVLSEIEEKNKKKKEQNIVAFTIPIVSVGGYTTLHELVGNEEEEGEKMETNLENELIIVIANRGHVDMVMDAARKGGAKGGTVIHARGTGLEQSEKFFGVTIGAEKEMIFIVTEKEKKQAIMKTIMEEAGNATPAGAMLFTLPVTDVIGTK